MLLNCTPPLPIVEIQRPTGGYGYQRGHILLTKHIAIIVDLDDDILIRIRKTDHLEVCYGPIVPGNNRRVALVANDESGDVERELVVVP